MAAHTAKFDVREDEEQYERLQDCVDLLVASGYFRARIKGLPAFDKVVGGMVWCISVCNHSVDVDLLYAENATIGQKISLTEKIVEILPALQCPHAIEPHQIQGLDFIHIYPVVQWLVKRAIEAKAEHGDDLESYADYQYAKGSQGSSKDALDERFDQLSASVAPERHYKRGPNTKPETTHEDALCTLAEYSNTRLAIEQSDSPSQAVDSLEHAAPASRVSEETIRQIMEASPSTSSSAKTLTPKERLALIDRQIEEALAEDSRLVEELSREESEREVVREELRREQAEKEERNQFLAQIPAEDISEMMELLSEYDRVVQRDKQFKASCRRELAAFDQEIAMLNGIDDVTGKSSLESELESDLQAVEEELAEQRLFSAEVSRRVAQIQRHLDSVPSQVEMAQYQQRFVELYNQMASRHRQTKQYFTLHNTLLDVRNYMKREIDMLSKIEDVLPMATKDAYRDSFIQNLQEILRIVESNHAKIAIKSADLEKRRAEKAAEYSAMKDSERAFHRATQQFQEACRLNEQLHVALSERNG